LSEIRELLSLRVGSNGRCEAVKRRSEAKLTDIEAKIRSLQRIRRTLRKLVNDCDERAPASDCPILGAMEKETPGYQGSSGGGRG
jgi:MerR family mercuric resistance operon transcriptional regulator